LLIGQNRRFSSVLAVSLSTVVYRNLLFSAHFVQAGEQEKAPRVR